MRRSNSEFQTLHISEEGQKLSNRDYFGYVEMLSLIHISEPTRQYT